MFGKFFALPTTRRQMWASGAMAAATGSPETPTRRRLLLGLIVPVAVCLLLAGCGSSPSKTAGSTQASSSGSTGTTTCGNPLPPRHAVSNVAVKVLAVTGGSLVTADVCVGGKGPYPFVVDTGTSRSIIDSALASSLNLKHPKGGDTVGLSGSGCDTTGTLVEVPALRMGDVALAPQAMVTSSLSNWAGQNVDGVLGSDVLGRFGAVKLDLNKRTLTVASTEGPATSLNSLVLGNAGAVLPTGLLKGQTPTDVVAVNVVQSKGATAAFVSMTVDKQASNPFVVDTGAPVSTMDKTAAYTAKISNKGSGPAPAGIGCSGTVTKLAPVSVSIGSTSTTLSMLSIHIAGPLRSGVIGYLGLDFLGKAGAVIIDYTTGTMAFLSQ